MLPHHKKVLNALATITRPSGELCTGFRTLAQEAEMEDVKEVRRIVRRFWRRGWAEYHKGLVREDDGAVAGAGYCISRKGLAIFDSSEMI